MERSTSDRFLTTHTGSLARAPELRELLANKDAGLPYDRPGFDALVSTEVQRVVHEQAAVGLDIINDGEQGKSSFVAYRLERLSGFELVDASQVTANTVGGLVEADDFPSSLPICGNGTAPARTRPLSHQVLACTAPIGWEDFSRSNATSTTFALAAAAVAAVEVFMTSISPATYAPPNLHYPSEDAYLDALAAAMSPRIQSHTRRRVHPPDRRPRPDHHVPDEPHERIGTPPSARPAGGGHQPSSRRPAPRTESGCTSAGAPTRRPTIETSRCKRHRPRPYYSSIHKAWRFRVPTDGTPTNGRSGKKSPLPDDKVLIPGRHRLDDQRDRAPRGRRRTDRTLRQ